CMRGALLGFPNGRTRAIDGKTKQPHGQPLAGWWPTGKPAPLGWVIVCEGESDALAMLTAQTAGGEHDLAALTVVSIPGVGFQVKRLADELQGAELVILGPDADPAGAAF